MTDEEKALKALEEESSQELEDLGPGEDAPKEVL